MKQARVYMKVKSGVVTESDISDVDAKVLHDKSIQDVKDFNEVLGNRDHEAMRSAMSGICRWLNTMFGKAS